MSVSPFPLSRGATVASVPGLVISAAIHLALVGAFLFESRPSSQSTTFDEPLPEGLTFLVPPSASPVSAQATPRFQEMVGDDGDAEGTRQGERADRDANRTGTSATRAVGSEVAASATEEGVTGENASDVYADAFMDVDVDSAAVRDPESAAPVYPAALMALGIEGFASVRFVVDTTGRIDLASVQIIEATRPEFAQAILDAVPEMKFTPARMGPVKVRQLAEQLFRFAIQRPVPPPAKAVPPAHE